MTNKDLIINEINKLKTRLAELEENELKLKISEKQLNEIYEKHVSNEEELKKAVSKLQASEISLREAKNKAEEEEYKYKLLADNISDVVFLIDFETSEYEYVSPSVMQLLGYTQEEIIDGGMLVNLTPESVKYLESKVPDRIARFKNGIEELFVDKLEQYHKNGTTIWTEVKARYIKNSKSGRIEIIGVARNISEQMKYEQELLKAKEVAEDREQKIKLSNEEIELNNERLESLLKISQFQTHNIQELLDFALDEAISLTKSKIGYIYFYNENSKQFILNTWSKGVMKECAVMDPQTVYDLDSTGCWGEAVRQKRPIVINDYSAKNSMKKGTPDGHVQLTKFLTIPVIIDEKIVAVTGVANKATDYDNKDIRQLTLLMDNVWKISERIELISDLKSAKEKAEESDRLKSAFLANMSHEIRTPMNGIMGFTELLKKPDLTSEQKDKFIEIIRKSGDRMLSTVNDIIDISKIDTGQVQLSESLININNEINSLFDFFQGEASAKGIEIRLFNNLTDADNIITDRIKFISIITNLIKNSIKYTDKGTIDIFCERTGDKFEFKVIDTGIGIPENRIESVFNRFEQADVDDTHARQGSGLGLSISKSYVEMLEGRIGVESKEGKGSTFYFTLPWKQNDRSQKTLKEEVVNSALRSSDNKLVILIAEDDDTSFEFLEIMMEDISNKIIRALNGKQVVEIMNKNPEIDIILMDIKMPIMDGYEAAREIRKTNKDVVIIAQTAYALKGDDTKVKQAGCNDYVSKPINKDILLQKIGNYLKID